MIPMDLNEMLGGLFAERYPEARIPPPSYIESGAAIIAFEPANSLVVQFVVKERQTGPMGILQGGILCALFDDVFGPLSFATAKAPCVSVDMNVSFVRASKVGDTLTIRAEFISKTKKLFQMRAEAHNERGRLVAVATSNLMVYEPQAT
jgi:uncharacterized protein (TIGR00369 family)